MSSVFTYEINQLGAGRWQRASVMSAPAPQHSAPVVRRRRVLRWSVATGLALAVLITTLFITRGGQRIGGGLSGYLGAGGSYQLAVGLSGAGPLALASAPPPASALPPAATSTAAPPAPPTSASTNRAQRIAAPGDYNLLGKPSISVATIEQVLKQYNSPAVGDGQAFYDLGVKYGVDPAFMLAFFVHESAAGTQGAAVATKSVGNIICAGWAGQCIGRFRAYDSYVQAAEDWYQLITGPLYIGAGLATPDAITPRYAPSSDNNDPGGYAETVERLVDEWRSLQG